LYRLRRIDCRLVDGRSAFLYSFAAALTVALAGCVQPVAGRQTNNQVEVRRRAMEGLKAAVVYRFNPAVRVEAIEALSGRASDEGTPWVRSALLDDHPAVRFAACVAVGEARDLGAEAGVTKCLKDANASVRVAALFARHRLGHTERSGDLAGYLLHDSDAMVRRNAALVLGLLGEQGAVKVLAKGMKDADAGVRDHSLEAMARLGNREARQELTFMTGAGVGSDEVFAISALAATGDSTYSETFRYKLATATHLETRLAAARGLGLLHSDEGFETAMRALRGDHPTRSDPLDPTEGQMLRTRQLAAAALGAIGRADALPLLAELLDDPRDPRVQVSAARAILDILDSDKKKALPFAAAQAPRKQ
jgi:HEAT repeat protein